MKYILYRKRAFSEKFNLAFDWLRDNWRPILRFSTIFLLPISLLQGFGYSDMTGLSEIVSSFSSASTLHEASIWAFFLSLFCSMAGIFLSYSLFFSLIKLSFVDGADLKELSLRDVWRTMKKNMGRLLLGGFLLSFVFGLGMSVVTVVSMPFIQIAYVGGLLLFLILLALCLFAVVLLPFLPIYMLDEDVSFDFAFSQGFRLGWKCIWGFLGVAAVVGVLSYTLAGLGHAPVIIFLALKPIVLSRALSTSAVLVDFFIYLSSVVASYVGFLVTMLSVLTLSIQTGHAADKIDGVSADDEIDGF